VAGPVIVDTERLTLRPWRAADDLPALAALCADAEVMRCIAPNRPLLPGESAALLERIEAHWRQHGYGLWAVEPRDHGGCIGFAGLAIPSFLPDVLPAVEVGWRLDRAWWGRGLATEAARASVAYGFETLGLGSVVSIIDSRNGRSLRVAEKLGMRPGPDRLHPVTRRRLRVMQVGRAQGDEALDRPDPHHPHRQPAPPAGAARGARAPRPRRAGRRGGAGRAGA
jgi:RimJ/RimL family protein N-acetyltransferase